MAYELTFKMFTSTTLLLFTTIFIYFIYQSTIRTWNYFTKQNVKSVRGLPILGTHWRAMLGLESIPESFRKLYAAFPNDNIIGIYELFGKPAYLIRDINTIKAITIKDFDHFQNHSTILHEDTDALFSKSVFTMRGKRWHEMRTALSPAFTGAKMRLMFGLIDDVARQYTNHLKLNLKGQQQAKKFELRQLFDHLACDTIASCAFGMNVNSIENPKNEFAAAGDYILNRFGFKLFLFNMFPKLMNFFRIHIFDDKQTEFFRDITRENMNYRKTNQVKRNDFIDLLIEIEKGKLKYVKDDKYADAGFATVQESAIGESYKTDWTNDEFAAQALTFFLAGHVGMVIGSSFACYELAINPEIQSKLYQECREVDEQLQGKPTTYEVVQKMKYLDLIVSETLRRWPLAPMLDRSVNKEYSIENTDGSVVQLNVGDALWIPTQGLHMDPKFFPNPLKFDPERFNDDNRTKEMVDAYMPFGNGPRNCIGSRFALMQQKVLLYRLILNFKLSKCDQTQVPLELKKGSGSVEAANGFWINIEQRV